LAKEPTIAVTCPGRTILGPSTLQVVLTVPVSLARRASSTSV
jgi:hypothetical protein